MHPKPLLFFFSIYGMVLLHAGVSFNLEEPWQFQESETVSGLLEQSRRLEMENPDKARASARRAMQLATKTNHIEGLAESHYQLGAILIRQGATGDAFTHFITGFQKSSELRNPRLIAVGHYHLCRYHEVTGNYPKALEHIRKAKLGFQDLDNQRMVANCNNSLGRIYQKIGDYDNALSLYIEALRIKEANGNEEGIAVAKTNIGNIFLLTSRFRDAIRYFSDALEIDKATNSQEGILISNLNLGAAYNRSGDHSKALSHFRASLEIAEKLDYLEDQAILHGNIGSALREQGYPEQGLEHLVLALSLKETHGFNEAHTLNDLAETYLVLKAPENAVAFANRAIAYAKIHSDAAQAQQGYYNLARALMEQKQFEKAYQAIVQSNNIRDSLFTKEKEKQISNLQISYETEKKEAKINLLTLENEAAVFRSRMYVVLGLLACLTLFLLWHNQRIKHIKNRKLLYKEKEIARIKSNFFSNVSHEFRTPLTLILGPIEIFKEHISNPKLRDYLDKMQRSAERLLTLINQLLDLSKLESGGYITKFKPLDAVSLVRGVTMTFTSLMETKNISLTVNPEIPYLMIRADQEKLETILINILSNAFKHTNENGSIVVTTAEITDPKKKIFCEIVVQDNGNGIHEKVLPHIFDRYYQGSEVGTGFDTGYGIGLALTKELVELHDGSIEIFSRPGEGTRVVIRLPQGEISPHPTAVATSPTTRPNSGLYISGLAPALQDEPAEVDFTSSRNLLLVIEDNADVMFYLKSILSERYELVTAVDGEEGIIKGIAYIPDLIISDVMMPKVNGYKVCSRLKKDEKTSHIPILLLTAKAAPEDKIEGLTASADAYLTKPFFPKELLLHVENLINSRKALRERFSREVFLKPSDVRLESVDEAFLKKVQKVVEDHLDDETFNMEKLGAGVGMSRSQIHRKLHALTNQSATQFIRGYRLERALSMLHQNAGSIAEIAYSVGFSDPSYFSRCFQHQYSMTPSQAQKVKDN